MKIMKTSSLKKLVFLMFFLLVSLTALPQGQGGGPGTPPPPPPGHGNPNDQPAPLGSGLGILALLGIAYGAKKVYDARKDFRH